MLAHPTVLSSAKRGFRIPVQVILALALLDLSGWTSEGGEAVPQRREGSIEALRLEFSDPFRAAYNGQKIAERLLQAVKDRPGTPEEAEARLAAAEALDAAGEETAAHNLRNQVIREGPGGPERAKAAFAAGLRLLIKENPESAGKYWKNLPRIAPESPWALQAGRFLPYLEMVRTRDVPAFAGDFAVPGEASVPRTLQGLSGRAAILFVWSSSVPDWEDQMAGLARDLTRLRAKTGGAPEVLCINLDTGREAFEGALRHLTGPDGQKAPAGDQPGSWPQHHDGQGFQGPLARAFAIPRVPQWILLGPDGKLLFAGGQFAGKKSLESALFPQAPAAQNTKQSPP